jgi:hypothetical protein
MKTVVRRIPETVCEHYVIPGRLRVRLDCGKKGDPCNDPCANPCACECPSKRRKKIVPFRLEREPDRCATRLVTRYRTVCEQVPVTTMVRKCRVEKVPVTICKKVPVTVTKQVPVTCVRTVTETIRKQVPYTVTRMQTEVVRTKVPYTVTRRAMGCWMSPSDAAAWKAGRGTTGGQSIVKASHNAAANESTGSAPTPATMPSASDRPGDGRVFVEGAFVVRDVVYTTTRMVPETRVIRVPYTVTRTIQETHIKKVPYTVCRMVPHKVTRTVQETTCKLVPHECVKHVPTKVCTLQTQVVCVKVPYTVCKTVPYTVCVKVPYTVTEMVPTTVRKTVKVCVPYDVCVRKARYVPYTICDAAPCDPCCGSGAARKNILDRLCGAKKACCDAGQACGQVCCPKTAANPVCEQVCAKPCCDQSCPNAGSAECGHLRKRSGLLARFFHRRLACEPVCCGCTCDSPCSK